MRRRRHGSKRTGGRPQQRRSAPKHRRGEKGVESSFPVIRGNLATAPVLQQTQFLVKEFQGSCQICQHELKLCGTIPKLATS